MQLPALLFPNDVFQVFFLLLLCHDQHPRSRSPFYAISLTSPSQTPVPPGRRGNGLAALSCFHSAVFLGAFFSFHFFFLPPSSSRLPAIGIQEPAARLTGGSPLARRSGSLEGGDGADLRRSECTVDKRHLWAGDSGTRPDRCVLARVM